VKKYFVLAQQFGLIGILNALIGLSVVIILSLLTKTTSVEEYGIWVQLTVMVSLVPMVVTLGLPYTMVRFLAGEKKKEVIQDGFYTMGCVILLISACVFIILLSSSIFVSETFFNSNTFIGYVFPGIIFFECLNLFLLHYFRTFQQIKQYTVYSFLKTYLMVGLTAIFVYLGQRIDGAACGLLLSNIVTFLILLLVITREIGFVRPTFKHLKDYLSFGIPTIPANVSTWIVNSSDRFFIAMFLGVASVGYYYSGYTLGNLISMFIAPLGFLLPAVMSKCYDEDNSSEFDTLLKYSMKYFLLLTIPSMVGLTILAKPLLSMIATPEIAEYSYIITPVVALSGLILGFYTILVQIIFLEKRTKLVGSVWMIAAVVNAGLNIIFIPIFGILGAAVTMLIAYTIATGITARYALNLYQCKFDTLFAAKSVFASVIMSLYIFLYYPANFSDTVLCVGTSIVIYAVSLMLLKGFDSREIQLFKLVITEKMPFFKN